MRPAAAQSFDHGREFLDGARRRVLVRAPQPRAQQVIAAEHVQRQVAVTAVVAVEEATLLGTVQRIVRRVQVQPELPRRLGAGLHEQLDQQIVQGLGTRHDPLVAVPRPLRLAKLQPVQRTRAGQRRTPVPVPRAIRTGRVRPADQQRQHRVAPQRVVVVEILIAQRQRVHALRDQRAHIVFHARRVAVVLEAARQAPRQIDTPVHLAQQQATAVRTQVAAVVAARHQTPSEGLEIELCAATLCVQRLFPFVGLSR